METTDQGRYSTIELRVRATEAVSRGLPLGQVADAYGVDRTTLFRLMKRYGHDGIVALQRKEGSGRPGFISKWRAAIDAATEDRELCVCLCGNRVFQPA